MDALRRAAESEMRREAPRGALGESSKRRRVNDEDDGNGDGGQGGSDGDGDGDGDDLSLQPQRRPWLRFAYSGSSFLENESTLGFVVSSMIRKERSASREATGVLCSLLGVPEAEEEEQEEEKEAEGGKGEEEKDKGEKAGRGDEDEDEDEKKKPSGPCLTPTLSPVREREKNRERGVSLSSYLFLLTPKWKRKTENGQQKTFHRSSSAAAGSACWCTEEGRSASSLEQPPGAWTSSCGRCSRRGRRGRKGRRRRKGKGKGKG